jgi:hypothetical protein
MAGAPTKPLQFDNPVGQAMSTDPEMEALQRRAWRRAQNEYAGEVGEAWVKRLEGEFAPLPNGTHVIINCRTGKYVHALTLHEAIDEFERQFGREIGYLHRVGGGYFVGGGIG